MLEKGKFQKCIDDSTKYEQTVTVLSAIYETIAQNPNIGTFVGVEHTIETEDGNKITPDLTATYEDTMDKIQQCIFFELKWSITSSTVKDEIHDLKRYINAKCKITRSSKTIQQNDTILICHLSDLEVVISSIEDLRKSPENDFLKSGHFAIWTWAMVRKKKSNKTADDEMVLRREYGKTKNKELERLMERPGGISVHSDVLRFLRLRYRFTKQKPPIQYTMRILLMHVFFAHGKSSNNKTIVKSQQTDYIYEFMKILFPGWAEATTETVQAHKRWIMEAINKFKKLRISVISPPKIRRTYEEWICGKLQQIKKKAPSPYTHRPKQKTSTKEYKMLENFFPKGNT